jgi:hypothetical protein
MKLIAKTSYFISCFNVYRLNAGGKLYSNTLENPLTEKPASMDLAPVITVSRLHCELQHDQFQV